MSAYAETYLPDAQRRMGAMLDFAVNGCALDLKEFYQAFLEAPVSGSLSRGDVSVVAGRSGEEIVLEVIGLDVGVSCSTLNWMPSLQASQEYWCGWALAFYQWASGYSYDAIERRVRISEIHGMYFPYHEMDIRHFCDRMDELAMKAQPQTNLQVHRRMCGLSQRQLAEAAQVPLRTLQQYEQRQKNINYARASYVEALARSLGCGVSDLLERSAVGAFEYEVVSL